MEIGITLSVNAGVALQAPGLRLWIDALPGGTAGGFSALTPPLFSELLAHPDFVDPDAMLFTHCHCDHYSKELLLAAAARWPRAAIASPEPAVAGQLVLAGEATTLRVGAAEIAFFRLSHEGEQYANVPHYGIRIAFQGIRILIPGDCAVASPALLERVAGERIDLLLVDFPWVCLPRGREAISDALRPRAVLCYHLPLPGEDRFGYAAAAARALPKLRSVEEKHVLQLPFSVARFSL